jgi:Glycosyltransferases involved in cell wall biogenesis
MQFMPKISILIPVFNGRKFIRETLDAILAQSFSDYEVICVNDCSTDGSLDILNGYAAADSRFRVYTTDKNLGYSSAAAKFGLQFVKGDYYAYSSQDDLFSNDWLSSLYYRAMETGADAVVCDMVFFYANCPERNIVWPGVEALKGKVITGRQAFLYSLDETIHNFALWNRRLIDDIGYYDFGMRADEYTYRVWFLNCNKVVTPT